MKTITLAIYNVYEEFNALMKYFAVGIKTTSCLF